MPFGTIGAERVKTLYKFFFSAAENVILPVKVRKAELTQIHIITGRIGKKNLSLPDVLTVSSVCSSSYKLHFMQANSSRLPVSKGS